MAPSHPTVQLGNPHMIIVAVLQIALIVITLAGVLRSDEVFA